MKSLYNYTILIVEDEDAIRQNYVTHLKRSFVEVLDAKDAFEALELYARHKPHIMIVDINMPGMNGIEFLYKIRQNDQRTKAIMLTAYTDTDLLLKANELKLTKYLVKPIARKKLSAAIELAIEELQSFDVRSKQELVFPNGYIWNFVQEQLLLDNEIVKLTKKEQRLMLYLMNNVNEVCTYDDLICHIWSDEDNYSVDSLKTLVKKVRKKLPEGILVNLFGVGYKVSV